MKKIFKYITYGWLLLTNVFATFGNEQQNYDPEYASFPMLPIHVHLEKQSDRIITPIDQFMKENFPQKNPISIQKNAQKYVNEWINMAEKNLNITISQLHINQNNSKALPSWMSTSGNEFARSQIFIIRNNDIFNLTKGDPASVINHLFVNGIRDTTHAISYANHMSINIWNSVYKNEKGELVFSKCIAFLLWNNDNTYKIYRIIIYSETKKWIYILN